MNDNLVMGFRDRYAIESFPAGEGLIVDLVTGAYFQINSTSVLVCEALMSTDTVDQATSRLAWSMGISMHEAGDLVMEVEDGLSRGIAAEKPPGPLFYRAEVNGFAVFGENERPIFSVDALRGTVKVIAAPYDLGGPLALYLRSLMPKLLALRNIPILHASSFRIDSSLIAVTGKSGAGKTTTARAFAHAGAALVSEDMLVLSLLEGSLTVFTEGEKVARAWAQDVAIQIERAPEREISFSGLAAVPVGETEKLDSLWLIDAKRRSGDEIRLRALSAIEGLKGLLGSGFLATSDPKHWREFLARSRHITDRVRLAEGTMPHGRESLARSVARYMVKLAS